MAAILNTLWHDLQLIKQRSPLIHNITNFVTMEFMANALLATGASPIMAHAHEKVAGIAAYAHALNNNIGTLDRYWEKHTNSYG